MINELEFKYQILDGHERERVFLRVLRTLAEDLEVAGPARQGRWEMGWAENLRAFVESDYDIAKLVPKYNRRNEIMRLDGEYIQPVDAYFETNFVKVFRLWLFGTWLSETDNIYEFGCGTGYHLATLAERFPDKTLHGLDWAESSLEILRILKKERGYNLSAERFNMLSPNFEYGLKKSSAVFTAGSLEQLGGNSGLFVDYLLKAQPDICVHWEPLMELYGQDSLFDYVAAEYSLKRGYLQGFVPRLQQLEKEGQVEILQIGRTLGSLFHDGYSYLVWRPMG